MYEVINSPHLPPQEKTSQRLIDESILVVGAGLSTTGWAATVTIYYILANPAIQTRLRNELLTIIPPGHKRLDCADLDWAALRSLPYLQACITEGLRLSYGTTSRLARRTPKKIIYTEPEPLPDTTSERGTTAAPKQWVIPPNTPVSVSIYILHHSERIFPDSHAFVPDRWLGEAAGGARVPDRYFGVFSKGARSCLGMHLAWAELSVMIAGTIRWFELELHETGERDVVPAHEYVLPATYRGSKGVRAKVVREFD